MPESMPAVPHGQGVRYPFDPPKAEEIVTVMRVVGDGAPGRRLRGPIVVLWRAGLGLHEARALRESDLDRPASSTIPTRDAAD